MFAAIAMAAARSRASAATASATASAAQITSTPALPATDFARYVPRETLADLVAHAAPRAPGAGFASGLASSPFAPALRHVISLGTAPSFDVRALYCAGLSATYLSGLMSAATNEISIAASTTRDVAELDLPLVAPAQRAAGEREREGDGGAAPLTTLRSALLSFELETLATGAAASGGGAASASAVT